MTSVVNRIFGGTDRSAQAAQAAANRDAQEFIKAQGAQARGDVLALAPGAEQARLGGFQAALDVLGQTIPQQIRAFQRGNIEAQQALAGGLPQFQAALLGQPVDFGAFQPRTAAVDPSQFQVSLPDFQGVSSLLAGAQSAQPTPQQAPLDFAAQLSQLLGGDAATILPELVQREGLSQREADREAIIGGR